MNTIPKDNIKSYIFKYIDIDIIAIKDCAKTVKIKLSKEDI
jgi:hypothetical protein